MRHGLVILATGSAELLLAAQLPTPMSLVVGHIGVVTALVGLATLVQWPGLLGKRADGSLPWWSYVLFWPWHALLRTILLARRHGTEPVSTPIHPGWILGAWPHSRELWTDWPAVIDMTCEIPRHGPPTSYLNLPTWDASAPTIEDIDRGVAFALDQRAGGRAVLVHCAAGHGRSATLLAAALVAAGLHPDWRAAVAHMRSLRPHVRLAPDQQRALDQWTERRTQRISG